MTGSRSPACAEDILPLSFGVYTSDKPTTMYRQFKPIALYLQAELSKTLGRGVRINLRIFRSYEGARSALEHGTIDFARFGPASYIITRDRDSSIRLLAAEEVEGQTTFKGVIFARKDSGIKSLADLRGRSFAFGDRTSTIGRFLSQKILIENRIRGNDLKSYAYLGRHDRVVSAVLAGQFDAGAAKESTYSKLAGDELLVLEAFDNATKPWVASGKLAPHLVDALRGALLKVGKDGADKHEAILEAIGKKVTGFVAPERTDYSAVKEAMDFIQNEFESSESFESSEALESASAE